MTIIIALALFLFVCPSDGGNHPRKEEMTQPIIGQMSQPFHNHPPKEWDV